MQGPEFLERLKRQFRRINGVDERVVELLGVALLSGRRILLEGDVELAKIIVRVLADSTGLTASLIQPSPELMSGLLVSDSLIKPGSEGESEKSPLSANVVFIYDLARPGEYRLSTTEPFWQKLLEVLKMLKMLENEEVFPEHFPEPFIVMISGSLFQFFQEGFPDIFIMRVKLRHFKDEKFEEGPDIQRICDRETVLQLIDQAKLVWVSEAIFDYIYEIALKIRADERVAVELSHEASEHLLLASKALAFLIGSLFPIFSIKLNNH